MSKTIEFFWDPASSYSYLAATQIEALAQRTGATLVWKPFLLGKAFEATGNRIPASVPAKAAYMFKDLALWARYYGVPFKMPSVFPVHSVAACRMACAAGQIGKAGVFSRAVLDAYWVRDQDISKPDNVKAAAVAAGLDGEALTAAAQTDEVKALLKANTDEAIARGVFGAPTFFIDQHMFWGNDRLALMEAYLSGKLA